MWPLIIIRPFQIMCKDVLCCIFIFIFAFLCMFCVLCVCYVFINVNLSLLFVHFIVIYSTDHFCLHSNNNAKTKKLNTSKQNGTTTTTTTITVLRDYPGEPVPEETLTHPPSWSSTNLYQLLPSTTIHSILLVQITCLAIFLHNLFPSFHVLFGLPLGLEPSTSYSIISSPN